MSYLCELIFIFSFIFIVINHISSFQQTYLFFVPFLEYLLSFLDDNVDERKQANSSHSEYCLGLAWFFAWIFLLEFQVRVAYKSVAYKRKRV